MSFGWYDRVLAIPYREWQQPDSHRPTLEWQAQAERILKAPQGHYLKLTTSRLRAAVEHIQHPADWVEPLNDGLAEFGITDPGELAVLLAQLGHESMSFNRLEENLNYTAGRLHAVWPTRFPTVASAKPYERNPPALAAKVYGSRLGNRRPSEGWHYRGRGLIMLTGRANYERCSLGIGVNLVGNPELLLLPEVAVRAALWYWDTRVEYPRSIVKSTVDINGGLNGIEDRKRRWRVASVALGGMR